MLQGSLRQMSSICKDRGAKDDFYLLFFQAAIMTINNAVCRDLEQIGGLEALLSMEDADFKVAQDQIMTPLHRNLVD
jgi:hypothetical protein